MDHKLQDPCERLAIDSVTEIECLSDNTFSVLGQNNAAILIHKIVVMAIR